MVNVAKMWCFLLLGGAAVTPGCGPEGDTDDAEREGSELAKGDSTSVDDEPLGESRDPQLLSGFTAIEATNGKCWKARRVRVQNQWRFQVILRPCPDADKDVSGWPAVFGWEIQFNATKLIRNAQYPTKCVRFPNQMKGKLALVDCDPNDSYQWFEVVPSVDDQGQICAWVKGPAGESRCVTHKGGAFMSTTTQALAPTWYRHDVP